MNHWNSLVYAQVLIKKLTVLKKGASKRLQNDDVAYYDRVLNQLSTACTHLEECDVSSNHLKRVCLM